MAPDNFKLTKAAALKYQAHSVPAMFEPLAWATLAKITMPKAGNIVDVACGTGALTRLIAEKMPGRGKITGTDLNATMIEVAKATQPATRHEIDWCVADIGNLPFDGGRFDMAFVQSDLGAQIMALPVEKDLRAKGVEVTDLVISEVAAALAPYDRNGVFVVPQEAHFFEVRKN